MPTLSHIAVYPVKALDPVARDRVTVTDIGGLAGDRAFAIVDEAGEYVNGKRTDAVHRLRSDVDLEERTIGLAVGEDEPERFHLDRDREAIEAWLGEYLGLTVRLEERTGGAQTDRAVYSDSSKTGPTLVSTATLRKAASWYDDIDATGMRLRLRPNLVVAGVPAFWEDRLLATHSHVRIGDVRLEGVEPVPRCIVPVRDPQTGKETEEFRKRFVERREATLPAWMDSDLLDGNFFSMTVGTRIPEADRDGTLAVGDDVELVTGG
ncbi:MAG: MOSC N-terminal beta barrel domain-containing protein, partial [Halovenus sp.]